MTSKAVSMIGRYGEVGLRSHGYPDRLESHRGFRISADQSGNLNQHWRFRVKLLIGGLTTGPGGLVVQLLGPVRLGRGHADTALPPKVRQILAVIALRAGSVVAHDTLISELWAEDPPRSAMTTMQTYIYQLRQAVDSLHGSHRGAQVLITESSGYLLRENTVEIDVMRFRELARTARAHLHEQPELAVSLARQALSLVRGEPLMDVAVGQVLNGGVVRLREEIALVQQLVIEAEIGLRRYSEAIVELHELCSLHPLREWFHYHLMDVLARNGRRAEALEVYADLGRRLRGELGIEPSQGFQQLHMRILDGKIAPDTRDTRPA
ncbi:AfsR/SARP family transcriptional regulator [Nocardia higoensis]|uniref:AfsR/SARP family transcriptional regulator n=1 Tax=Nocardia higoensis TaxID=228599 RepID=A0ABS0D7L9_9NOCA|nr:AfsR/SARP family transcriptional regulator [Nocardia higoensis]